MSAPLRRINEILAIPYSADDFKGQKVPPADDNSWLYNGEDELNFALEERQKEIELYNLKTKKKQKSKDTKDSGTSSDANVDDFDLGDIAKTMQQFVHKVSSYEGAEVPEYRDLKEVDLDVDLFIKDVESIMQHRSNEDDDEGSSSDMDFYESEDENEIEDRHKDNEDGKDSFTHSYSDAMNEELKGTTLKKTFVLSSEESPKRNEGTSKASDKMNEDFAPIDVDFNLVKNLLESFSSQQGLPGPASNLLGLMGIELHKDGRKGD